MGIGGAQHPPCQPHPWLPLSRRGGAPVYTVSNNTQQRLENVMKDNDRRELMRLVSGWLNDHGDEFVAEVIQRAHLGNPDGWLVTSENMGLLRQFRNTESGNPLDLIGAAINSRGGE